MDHSNFIVAQLIAAEADGTQFDIIVRVGKPLENNGCYACTVQLVGINDKVRKIYGEEPMQTMFLALKFVRLHLEMEEERGVRLFAPGQDIHDEPFDWRQFWYGEKRLTAD